VETSHAACRTPGRDGDRDACRALGAPAHRLSRKVRAAPVVHGLLVHVVGGRGNGRQEAEPRGAQEAHAGEHQAAGKRALVRKP